MTKLKTIASLCLIIALASCQPSSLEDNTSLVENLQLNQQNLNTEEEESDLTHLERNLQWVSFITAKVLTESEEARGEFAALVDANGNVFLSDLIGDDSDALTFQGDFGSWAHLYTTMDVRRERERPPHPIGTKSLPATFPSSQEMIDAFFNLILNENCIEIYMPEGYNFEGNFSATSSAHPLTNAEQNYGYVRYYIENDEAYTTEEIVMNNEYLNENSSTIFIARPFIDTENGCLYEEYDVNFLDFMGN